LSKLHVKATGAGDVLPAKIGGILNGRIEAELDTGNQLRQNQRAQRIR
jgi:hypothetical protein